MKVVIVFGTRPEAIKMCPVIKAIKRCEGLECCVCVTGQHKDMLQQVLDVFHVKADYNLDIMREKQTLYDITYAVMEGIRNVIRKERPGIVLVHGDTTTTFAAALSCFYEKIPIGHVEAGLRTRNKYSPYPEEFNRQAVDIVSDLYFAPTNSAKDNLLKEGKKEELVFVTGNTAIDALKTTVREDYNHEILNWAAGSRMILLTAHRRENWGTSLENIFEAVRTIVDEQQDIKVVCPVHKNPIIQETAHRILGNHKRIKLVSPLNVIDFHNIIAKAYLILTDSGGIQEEAPSLGKPVLVLRDMTERPEGVAAGSLKLVGTDKEQIKRNLKNILRDSKEYLRMSSAQNPYGDGHASEKIVKILMEWRERYTKNEK
ncbi:non-hydrolyzing UDP-N-acetylglucosamine 2-epimerase [Claveliimonas bilis]|uniref:UDP-N-acetylglucosamine 2-epimerase (non-hydrolyzing) n=1 Tax=Claveliimonas bilis TaxID=3028070 RepID=A0ABN6Z3D9_9FIRM|nr:UDP-N-acetylglucosamine 2-epimerase (non-hydrolyzing) [Claveliimonas bilis]BDZ77057.1 UDP-N-acetylglucosamine 2-epimerase [Claveliimonas bilis]